MRLCPYLNFVPTDASRTARLRLQHVYVGDQRVHYRLAGDCPSRIILPAVPHSSAIAEPLITALADRHTVGAMDAPVYAESQTLLVVPPAVGYNAEALAETLNVLNLPRVDLHGVNSSEPVAVAFARRFPDRLRRLVLDRPPFPTDGERDELLQHD